MTHKHYPYTEMSISESYKRVGLVLRDVVHELSREHKVPLTSRVLLQLARGIALSAQAARVAPAQFDSENGRDALSAIAHAMSQRELIKLADSNMTILSKRWSQVTYVAILELSTPGMSVAELRRVVDIQEDPPRSPYTNKLFDKWMPK